MKITKPLKTATAIEDALSDRILSDSDHIQRLKFGAYDGTLESLEAKKLTVDRLSEGMLREEIARALEVVLAVEGTTLGVMQRSMLIEEVEHELTGYGPIQPFLDDPTVDDILVNGHDNIYVERGGVLEERSSRFQNDSHLMNIIHRIVGPTGRRVDEASPYVDARLPDGSRVNAIIPPVSLDGPVLSIRKSREQPFRAKDLVRFETLSQEMLVHLENSVQARLNILICGGTGSGKTTLLNALSGFIGGKERLVTIEDTAEIKLQQRHVVRLETRPPSPDNPNTEITARDLMRNVLRMRPDRIILGEVRGDEVVDMLQAMGTGHHGSMATIHANNAREALDRLEVLVSLSNMRAETRTLRRYIANSIQMIVQTNRMPTGERRVVSIAEVTGLEGDIYTINELFRYVQDPERPRFEAVSRHVHFAARLKAAERGAAG
jgi:pilus assembly protein CpaF